MKRQRSHYSESEVFVTDTHALLWHLTEDESLSKKAKEIFCRADQGEVDVVVPTTVLAEALFITEKHRVHLKFMKIIEDIRNSSNYLWYPLDLDVIMKCHELIKIPELHDRIIVATAMLLDSKLITKDPVIAAIKEVEVIW